MKHFLLKNKIVVGLGTWCLAAVSQASLPVWNITTTENPEITLDVAETKTISYTVSNNSSKPHQLVMKPQAGVSQLESCILGPRGSATASCQLTFSITASALPSNEVRGGPVLCQANANGTPNPNQCYQPSPGYQLHITRATAPGKATLRMLSPVSSPLVLSVKNPSQNAALTGKPRQITIQNTGSQTATGLMFNWPGRPADTNIVSTCGNSLAPGAICTYTIVPGIMETSGCSSGTVPNSSDILANISASNVDTPVNVNLMVLSYGCIYQGGFIFSIDDTTPDNQNIGGKVASLKNQASYFANGIIWSSSGGMSAANDIIYGISQISTPSSPDPLGLIVPGQVACNGRYDGACNSNNIIVYYSAPNRIPPVNLNNYAAGLCRNYVSDSGGYNDWYLPAICELGPELNLNEAGCAAGTQNILENLPFLIGNADDRPPISCLYGSDCLSGDYWSSTESSFEPRTNAWIQFFSMNPSRSSVQLRNLKSDRDGVRCVRAIIP